MAYIWFGVVNSRGNTVITVNAKKTWPTVFEGGAEQTDSGGYKFATATKFIGDETAGIKLVGCPAASRITDTGFTEFYGDMSTYRGTIMVGERHILRLGSESMPGTVEFLPDATAGLEIMNVNSSVSIGKLKTAGNLNVTISGTTKLVIGRADFGGIVNFICDEYLPGMIIAGSGATTANVRVNGQPCNVMPGIGAIYISDPAAEFGIEGAGTAEDPFVIGDAASRTALSNVDGEVIYVLPSEALPLLDSSENYAHKNTYGASYHGYFVDNYNAAVSSGLADDSGRAYCEAGYNNAGGVTFWSDEEAPHAGSNYVIYPEIWSNNTPRGKTLYVRSDMGDFGGDSLMITANNTINFYGDGFATTINKLVMMPDSTIYHQGDKYKGDTVTVNGKAYFRGTAAHPVSIRCRSNTQKLIFTGVAASPANSMLIFGGDTGTTPIQPRLEFTGNLAGFKGVLKVNTNGNLILGTSATNATIICEGNAYGLETEGAETVSVKSLTLNGTDKLTLNAPLKVTEYFEHDINDATPVDLTGIDSSFSGAAVLELPDAIDAREFDFTLNSDQSVSVSGNKVILTVTAPQVKKGTAILFK